MWSQRDLRPRFVTRQPSIFVSSTIYDFSDLRSAISHYYSERGFRVLLSEKADFVRSDGTHSYHACLDAIKSCQIFILLIGGRRGGWFDEKNHVSITQQEYRIAHALSVEGKMKIASFVRQEVWNARNIIKRVRTRHGDLSSSVYATIAQSAAQIQDYEHVITFVDEVARVEETKYAVSGGKSFPPNNWIVPFSSFSEITQGVAAVAGMTSSVGEASRRKIIEDELIEVLRHFYSTTKTDRNPLPVYELMPKRMMKDQFSSKEYFTLDKEDIERLGIYVIASATISSRLSLAATETAVKDGAFCQYDHTTGTIAVSELHSVLRETVQRWNQKFNASSQNMLDVERTRIFSMRYSSCEHIDIHDILFTIAHARAVKGMEQLLIRALVLLKGAQPSEWLYKKILWSPLQGVDDGIVAECPTADEMRNRINDGIRHS